jgi:hypothetical protein
MKKRKATSHFCGRVQSLDAFEDGCTIVRDDHFSLGSLDLEKR